MPVHARALLVRAEHQRRPARDAHRRARLPAAAALRHDRDRSPPCSPTRRDQPGARRRWASSPRVARSTCRTATAESVPAGEVGEVVVRGERGVTLFAGYLDMPEVTEAELPRPMVPHRRSCVRATRRPALLRRPPQRRAQGRGRERVDRRGRSRARGASRRARGGGRRATRTRSAMRFRLRSSSPATRSDAAVLRVAASVVRGAAGQGEASARRSRCSPSCHARAWARSASSCSRPAGPADPASPATRGLHDDHAHRRAARIVRRRRSRRSRRRSRCRRSSTPATSSSSSRSERCSTTSGCASGGPRASPSPATASPHDQRRADASSRAARTATIRAFSAICQHRGMQVAEGDGNCGTFKCPYHHWIYGLDGRLLGAPAMERTDGFDKKDFPLPTAQGRAVAGLRVRQLRPRRRAARACVPPLRAVPRATTTSRPPSARAPSRSPTCRGTGR